jgi:molybdopterin molybdotransferase
MTKKLKNTCVNEFDPDALEEEKAIKFILDSIISSKKKESLPIRKALGRVAGNNIKAKLNIPNFNNSAMDGYAINIKLLKKNNYILQQKGISLAGQPYSKKLIENMTIKVMTGAVIPNNCDAVVMKEMVDIKNDGLYFPKILKKNQNIRKIGEDIKKNDVVIKKGEIITHSHLGILSSLGMKEINVVTKPIISFFSTGDELVSMDTKLSKGMIYDSNRYILYGLLKKFPVIIKDMGVVRDNEKTLIKKLRSCSQKSDIIITTGGVSVGDADYIKNALNKLGNINFWKIAIKPGRPLAYGKINKSHFFGLPGNPVSAVVTFQLFVTLAIEKLIGMKENKYIKLEAITVNNLSKKKGRVEYKRGFFSQVNNQNLVSVSSQQGSNILTSLSNANCYIRLDSNVSKVNKGDKVKVIPFDIKI